MSEPVTCPECGAVIPLDVLAGLCPRCAAKTALAAPALNRLRVRYFGDYELLEEIGCGGMGVVYKARQVSLNRLVAVKLLLQGTFATDEAVQRFRTEAEAAANLQHPNIVAIHEVGVHEGQHYFSMDYVDGSSLAELVRDGPLPPVRAVRYVQIIAEAIHYAHQRAILHRDLKPSNILIDPFDQPRITDFGLAKRLDAATDLTLSGQVLGAPSHMPPEQAAGQRGQVGIRSDVYSLGAILYHLLTGRPPFQGASLHETLWQVLNSEPRLLHALNPDVPRDLETVCLKSLRKDPSARYASARELAEDLSRWEKGKPITARPVGRGTQFWRWTRRYPRTAALAGCVALALAGLLLLVSTSTPRNLYKESRLTPMPVTLSCPSSSDALAGRIYVFGGRTNQVSFTDQILVYEIAADAWREAKGRMPYRYAGAANRTAVWGGRAYISPGLGPTDNNGWGTHSRIIEFDPRTETATEKASFGAPLWHVSPVAAGNHIYWFGAAGLRQEHKIWRYSPTTDTLVHVSDFKGGPRTTSAIAGPDGRIYALGGQYMGRTLSSAEIYFPASNTNFAVSLPFLGLSSAWILWPGPRSRILLLGGGAEGRRFGLLDPRTRQVTDQACAFSFSAVDSPATSYDPLTGRVYFFGGQIGNEPVPDAYVLIPTEEDLMTKP